MTIELSDQAARLRVGCGRGSRRPVAQEPLLGTSRFDYADCFEIRTREPDSHSAEQWARAALEQAPPVARWTVLAAWRTVLQFRLGPHPSPDHVLGLQIITAEPEVIHTRATSPLFHADLVLRKAEPTSVLVTTGLVFRRPSARAIWALVGPLHRTLAPYLLGHAATTLTGP
jgi:hypothetical protein